MNVGFLQNWGREISMPLKHETLIKIPRRPTSYFFSSEKHIKHSHSRTKNHITKSCSLTWLLEIDASVLKMHMCMAIDSWSTEQVSFGIRAMPPNIQHKSNRQFLGFFCQIFVWLLLNVTLSFDSSYTYRNAIWLLSDPPSRVPATFVKLLFLIGAFPKLLPFLFCFITHRV